MSKAIQKYVELKEKRARFDQHTRDSWTYFKETRLHITGDELFAWLDTWGSEDESGPPECHLWP